METTTRSSVAEALREAGITQQALAAELELSQQAISDRYRGRTPWRVEELRTVARLTGRPLADLIEAA